MEKGKSRRFQAHIRADQHEQLRVLAFQRRVSMNQLLREILDEWLKKKRRKGKK